MEEDRLFGYLAKICSETDEAKEYLEELVGMSSIKEWRKGNWSKQDWIRFWLHFPVGGFNIFAFYVGVEYGISFCLLFIIYEIWEDFRIKDLAHKDILGYMWGFAVGLISLHLLSIYGIV